MIALFIILAVPPQIDLNQFLPPPPEPVVCSSDMLDYPPVVLPFDTPQVLIYRNEAGGIDDVEIPPGYVMSTCELLKITNLKVEAKRLRTELSAMRVLRDKEFALWRLMEQQYETELNRVLNPPWYERHRLAIGIAVGLVATSTVLLTSAQLIR
jgi:hypothetical protein